MVDEIVVSFQKARLLAFLRRLAEFSDTDTDTLMLLGLSVGLKLAANHPEVAANIMVELGAPAYDDPLAWVAYGPSETDPELPIN